MEQRLKQHPVSFHNMCVITYIARLMSDNIAYQMSPWFFVCLFAGYYVWPYFYFFMIADSAPHGIVWCKQRHMVCKSCVAIVSPQRPSWRCHLWQQIRLLSTPSYVYLLLSKYTHWQLAAGGTWKSHATNLHTEINSYLVIDVSFCDRLWI